MTWFRDVLAKTHIAFVTLVNQQALLSQEQSKNWMSRRVWPYNKPMRVISFFISPLKSQISPCSDPCETSNQISNDFGTTVNYGIPKQGLATSVFERATEFISSTCRSDRNISRPKGDFINFGRKSGCHDSGQARQTWEPPPHSWVF